MIVGSCPYCDQPWLQPIPDCPLPVIGRVECPECLAQSWMLFSRVDPEAIPLADWEPGKPWPGNPNSRSTRHQGA